MSNIAVPNTFAPLTVAQSSQVNANFAHIATQFNTYAVQTDVAKTITAVHTFAADILFADALYDIGRVGAMRPRDGNFSRNVAAGGTLDVAGKTTLNSAGAGSSVQLKSSSEAGEGSRMEWFSAFGSKVTAKMWSGASGASGGDWRVETLRDSTGLLAESIKINNAGAVFIAGALGINGKTAVANVAAPVAASDLTSVITLANAIRTQLINFGIYT